ncbi:hypothetical protein H6P81_020077 [Aristolochia fimbriata]|uniref:Uncharacterized protein n=1 Tax=Aristolochia fimbriata TaxID=158543 RepID=A0AAV7DTI0_ARIFI|nr:hypothetical protein H6P81_020077 [Aristolochia fimbriata]
MHILFGSYGVPNILRVMMSTTEGSGMLRRRADALPHRPRRLRRRRRRGQLPGSSSSIPQQSRVRPNRSGNPDAYKRQTRGKERSVVAEVVRHHLSNGRRRSERTSCIRATAIFLSSFLGYILYNL